jgi:cyclophilin family peptidyl-prolyl cis-trans isomerase
MNRSLLNLVFALALLTLGAPLAQAGNPKVLMETTKGNITLELDAAAAPETVKNFLQYVDDGFFDATIFHRIIDGFMVQGGGYTKDMERKPTRESINNEADNGLKNLRGTLAMARTDQPNSATAQFFINLVDNSFLDFRDRTRKGWGYCVFGKVVEGMDIVDQMGKLPTTTRPDGMSNVPIEPPLIKRMVRKD